MDPILLSQIISLVEWGLSGALALKENDTFNSQFLATLKDALDNNRPLTAEEWAPIHNAASDAHDALQGA